MARKQKRAEKKAAVAEQEAMEEVEMLTGVDADHVEFAAGNDLSNEASAASDVSEPENVDAEGEEEEDEEEALEMMAAMQMMREQELAEKKRETIDNKEALNRLVGEMSLKHLDWTELQTVTSKIDINRDDVHDDLKRELAFYAQALEASTVGLEQLKKAKVPTTRPADYFAEMVKTDAHMEKIRRKLLEERAKVVTAEESRRQRELKKYGKKVQQEKLIDRQRTKSAELDRIKTLKKKRKGSELTDDHDEDFDVAVGKATGNASTGQKNVKRRKKDERFGFGGKKRNSKSNTASSTDDMSGFSSRAMKGSGKHTAKKTSKQQRPGKARRLKSKM